MNAPRLLTLPETAVVLGQPYTTVRDWARAGAMPVEVVTISGRRFVRAADVADFLRITRDDIADLLAAAIKAAS